MKRLLPVLLLLSACYSDVHVPADVVAGQLEPGAVHLGVLLPLSEGTGLSHRDAVRLAEERVAAAGLAGGRPVVAVVADSRPEAVVGRSGVEAEVERRVRLLAGYGVPALVVAGDASALAARRAAASDGLAVLSYAAGAAELLETGEGRRAPAFSLAPPLRLVGPVLAALAAEAGHARLGVLRLEGDPFGEALAAAVEAEFAARGGWFLQDATLDPERPRALRDRLLPLLAAGPDVLIPALPPADAARLVNEVAALGADVGWVLPHTVVSPAFLDNVADLGPLAGAPALAPALGEGSGYADFEEAFAARFARPPAPFDSLAHDAFVLLALAAARAAAEVLGTGQVPASSPPVGRDLARHLPAVSAPPGERVGPADLGHALEILDAGGSVEYVGAWADVRLRADGEVVGDLPLQVYRLDANVAVFRPTEVRVVRAE